MTAECNGVIIILYSYADVSRNRVFILPDCAELCGLCL
nr:MAG TPA: hypothetical protein [Caudoviricetes sp.]